MSAIHNHAHGHAAANKAHYDIAAHEYDNIPMAKERSERFVALEDLVAIRHLRKFYVPQSR